MITYPNKDEIKKYRESAAISQSFLKSFYGTKTDESGEMKLGNLLDAMLTNPDELLDYIKIDNLPSDSIREAFRNTTSEDFEVACEQAVDYLQMIGFQANWKRETLLNKVKECEDYFKIKDKQFISTKDWEKCAQLAGRVVMDKNCKDYFLGNDLDVRYQFPIYFKYLDVECKGLSDIVVFHKDHIELIDIKRSSGGMTNWMNVMKRLNYPLQMAFYKEGLEQMFGLPVICKWLVAGDHIWMIEVPNQLLHIGKAGYSTAQNVQVLIGEDTTRTNTVLGFEHLLSKYKVLKENFSKEEDYYRQTHKGYVEAYLIENWFFNN